MLGMVRRERMSLKSCNLLQAKKAFLSQPCRVSEGWWQHFLERQLDLSSRQGDSTAHMHMDAVNQETIDQYFSILHDTLSTHGLLNKPAQIYNVDESGLPLSPGPSKVVTAKGRITKKSSIIHQTRKESQSLHVLSLLAR